MQGNPSNRGKNLAATPRYVSPRQLVLSGCETPFECELNKENPWVRLAHAIPWDKIVPHSGYPYKRITGGSAGQHERKRLQAIESLCFQRKQPYTCSIRLGDTAHPKQHREVYKAALQLRKARVKLPSSISKEYDCIATLFYRAELPQMVAGNSIMYVELFQDAACKLIGIDRTGNGRPGYFTRYLYEVAMNATNKYTYKLYMIIASWKQKGGFRILLEDLKLQMGIAPEYYRDYCDF